MESAVISQMELEGKMRIAYADDLRTVQQLIPYLQHRKQIAKKYFEGVALTEEAEKQLFELLGLINKDIAKVIGI